jgi:hypothetical protein
MLSRVRLHRGGTAVLVEWRPVPRASAYRIEYWELTDPSVKLAPRGEVAVGRRTLRHSISECPPGVHVLLRVVAVLAEGEMLADGPATRPVMIRVPEARPPDRLATPKEIVAALLAEPPPRRTLAGPPSKQQNVEEREGRDGRARAARPIDDWLGASFLEPHTGGSSMRGFELKLANGYGDDGNDDAVEELVEAGEEQGGVGIATALASGQGGTRGYRGASAGAGGRAAGTRGESLGGLALRASRDPESSRDPEASREPGWSQNLGSSRDLFSVADEDGYSVRSCNSRAGASASAHRPPGYLSPRAHAYEQAALNPSHHAHVAAHQGARTSRGRGAEPARSSRGHSAEPARTSRGHSNEPGAVTCGLRLRPGRGLTLPA